MGDNSDAFPNATETDDSDDDGVGDNEVFPFDPTETVDSWHAI